MDFTISDIEADIAEFEKRIDVARSKLADLPGRFVSYRGRADRQRQQLVNEIEHLKKLIEYAHEGIRLRQKEKNAAGGGRHEQMKSAGPPPEGTQTNSNNSDSDFIWCPVRLYGNAVQGDPCFVSFICIP